MSKGVFLLVFVFVLMMYILVATTSSVFILQRKAALHPLEGLVEVQKKGTSEWVWIRQPSFVTAGDRVRTDASGRAELRWIGPVQVQMEPHTTLRVQQATLNRLSQDTHSVFRLDGGKIWVRAAHLGGPQSRLEVRTRTATVAVKGTVFSVRVDRDRETQMEETEVEVFSGQVEVQDAATRQPAIQLQARQQVIIGPAILYPTPTRLGPADLNLWQKQNLLKPYLSVLPDPLPQRTRQKRLTLTGETEPQATVTINQQPVAVSKRGTFSWDLDLQLGPNEIEIVVRDSKGYTNRIKRTVERIQGPHSHQDPSTGPEARGE